MPGTPTPFLIGKNHNITLKRSFGSYKGLLIRLGGGGTTALSYQTSDSNLQTAAVCITFYPVPVSGITHTNNLLKNETNAILRVDTPTTMLPLDITVVIRNDGVSEFYYTMFVLNAVKTVPTPSPVVAPTAAPIIPVAKPIAPSSAPVAGPPTALLKVPAGYCFLCGQHSRGSRKRSNTRERSSNW